MKRSEVDLKIEAAKLRALEADLARAKRRVYWLKRASVVLLIVNLAVIGLLASSLNVLPR